MSRNDVCMVTGANAGIGKAIALGLAKKGVEVVMVCRSRVRGEAAMKEIRSASGNSSISLMIADLSSQAAIRGLAEDFKSRHEHVHVLINNAGMIPKKRELTVDGLEMQFAVNHLAYFLLTHLLLDVLERSAPARIINVASNAHFNETLHFNDLQSEKAYQATKVYSRSKLANILFTYELARRLRGTGITVNAMTPGAIATRLLGDYLGVPGPLRFASNLIGGSPEKGAQTALYLAMSPEVEGVTGTYFEKLKPTGTSPPTYDRTSARRLWEVSEDLTGISRANRTDIP